MIYASNYYFMCLSSSNRFHVIDANEQGVSFVYVAGTSTASGDAAGKLYRYARPVLSADYPVPASCAVLQASRLADSTHPPAVLANSISSCSFSFDVASQRNGMVQMTLG